MVVTAVVRAQKTVLNGSEKRFWWLHIRGRIDIIQIIIQDWYTQQEYFEESWRPEEILVKGNQLKLVWKTLNKGNNHENKNEYFYVDFN